MVGESTAAVVLRDDVRHGRPSGRRAAGRVLIGALWQHVGRRRRQERGTDGRTARGLPLATPFASGISLLSPSGAEADRLVNRPGSPTFPYDSPGNLAFTGKGNVLAINHAIVAADADHFAILDVWVADKGLPLERPVGL